MIRHSDMCSLRARGGQRFSSGQEKDRGLGSDTACVNSEQEEGRRLPAAGAVWVWAWVVSRSG